VTNCLCVAQQRANDLSAFQFAEERLEIMQYPEEIFWVLRSARAYLLEPLDVVLEIGSAQGGNLCVLSQLCNKNGLLLSISLGQLPPGEGEPHLPYKPLELDVVRPFISPVKLVYIDGDSKSPEVLKSVVDVLNGRSISVLFIDGDHSYDSTRSDFLTYSKLVSSPGVILFHDIMVNFWGAGTFWGEIKKQHPYKCCEFSSHLDNPRGIGLLYI